MYNTFVYNQKLYDKNYLEAVGYKAMKFFRQTYTLSFTGTKRTLNFIRSKYTLVFKNF